MLNESEIRNGLLTSVFGRKEIHVFDETDSTNDRAYMLADSFSPEGTIVVAESQITGKGRRGRKWVSIPGKSLSFSIILRPGISIAKAPGLTLLIAVALSDALHSFGIHTHRIKWPNDILINNKKISGILTEMKISSGKILFIIAGTGINTGPVSADLPDEIRDTASSIYDETGIVIDRIELLQRLLYKMENRYNEFIQSGLENILTAWTENSDIIGSTVSVNLNQHPVTGKVTGINSDGSLSIETDSGIVTLNSGEISIH